MSSNCVCCSNCQLPIKDCVYENNEAYCLECTEQFRILSCSLCDLKKERHLFYDETKHVCWECQKKKMEIYDKLKRNMLGLFDEFKKGNNTYNKTVILSLPEFECLSDYLAKNADSGLWAATLLGLNPKSPYARPIMLTFYQVKKLHEIVKTKIKDEYVHRFVHAMGPNTLQAVECIQVNQVFSYYRAFTQDEFIKVWNDKYSSLKHCSKFVVGECPICLEEILLAERFMRCDGCQKVTHFVCKLKHMQKCYVDNPYVTCENCSIPYDKENDVVTVYNMKSVIEPTTRKAKQLCWLDYLFD